VNDRQSAGRELFTSTSTRLKPAKNVQLDRRSHLAKLYRTLGGALQQHRSSLCGTRSVELPATDASQTRRRPFDPALRELGGGLTPLPTYLNQPMFPHGDAPASTAANFDSFNPQPLFRGPASSETDNFFQQRALESITP